MIAVTVAGRWMHEHRQTLAMEHQPWHDLAELLWSENRLVHGIEMGSDRLVMPAANLNLKIRQPRAYPCCRISRFRRIIINVGVITVDDTLGHRTPLP